MSRDTHVIFIEKLHKMLNETWQHKKLCQTQHSQISKSVRMLQLSPTIATTLYVIIEAIKELGGDGEIELLANSAGSIISSKKPGSILLQYFILSGKVLSVTTLDRICLRYKYLHNKVY